MTQLLRRIWYRVNRRRLEREMAEEMAFHRELMTTDRQRHFGSELRIRETAREVWGWTWLDRFGQDLKYASRVLRKSPGFTVTAMLILALGIGVPLTAFRQVLSDMQANGAPDPDTLVQLTRRATGLHSTVLPYPALVFYASNAQSFREVIALSSPYQAIFGQTDSRSTPEPIRVLFSTANYFHEFGIAAERGRLLSVRDEQLDAEPVALVGALFWQGRLGGDPSIVGQTIHVNGKPVRVVGIVPRSAQSTADVWMPLTRQPEVIEGSTLLTDWNSALDVYARLRSGVSPKTAEQETRALSVRLHDVQPEHVRVDEYLEARPILQFDRNSHEFQLIVTATALVMMLLAAACANLGLLVLARGVAREREIRTRMALGAGRARVVRQLLTESLLLAALSAVCALVISSLVLKAIEWQHNSTLPRPVFPGWEVLGATAGMAVFAALVFGVPPALRLTSVVPHGGRARSIFLSAQVAASCLLLVIASLLVSSIQRLRHDDLGIDYHHLLWISPGLKTHGYNRPEAQAYFDTLRARAADMPEVTATSVVWLAPWGDVHSGTGWSGRQYATNHVDANFLNVMGLHLIRGRNFLPGEEQVTIVTEAAARSLWPETDALGQTVPWDPRGPRVIGVVRDASTTVIGASDPLEFYVPLSPGEAHESVLLLRFANDPRAVVSLVQGAARNIDHRLQPVVRTLTDLHDKEVEKISRTLAIITMLGTVAILLSSIGLAGLTAYTVAQRTREIGVRRALGAQANHIVRAMFAPMIVPIMVGFLFGALGGAAVAKILGSAVSGIAELDAFDPLAYFAAMTCFTVIVALAAYAPTRRALDIHPSTALRHD